MHFNIFYSIVSYRLANEITEYKEKAEFQDKPGGFLNKHIETMPSDFSTQIETSANPYQNFINKDCEMVIYGRTRFLKFETEILSLKTHKAEIISLDPMTISMNFSKSGIKNEDNDKNSEKEFVIKFISKDFSTTINDLINSFKIQKQFVELPNNEGKFYGRGPMKISILFNSPYFSSFHKRNRSFTINFIYKINMDDYNPENDKDNNEKPLYVPVNEKKQELKKHNSDTCVYYFIDEYKKIRDYKKDDRNKCGQKLYNSTFYLDLSVESLNSTPQRVENSIDSIKRKGFSKKIVGNSIFYLYDHEILAGNTNRPIEGEQASGKKSYSESLTVVGNSTFYS